MNFLQLLKDSLPSLFSGLLVTLEMAICSIIFATLLWIIFGIFRISRSKILQCISGLYIDIIRGTPLLIQGLFLFFGVGQLLNIRFNPIVAGIICLSLNAGAYMAEIFRGGIMAVDIGQSEAARSLGLGYYKTLKKIVIPQAIKIIIPSMINQFITTLKDTSILSVISIRELTQSGQIIIARTYLPFQIYTIVAVMYFIIVKILTIMSKQVERNLLHGYRSW